MNLLVSSVEVVLTTRQEMEPTWLVEIMETAMADLVASDASVAAEPSTIDPTFCAVYLVRSSWPGRRSNSPVTRCRTALSSSSRPLCGWLWSIRQETRWRRVLRVVAAMRLSQGPPGIGIWANAEEPKAWIPE